MTARQRQFMNRLNKLSSTSMLTLCLALLFFTPSQVLAQTTAVTQLDALVQQWLALEQQPLALVLVLEQTLSPEASPDSVGTASPSYRPCPNEARMHPSLAPCSLECLLHHSAQPCSSSYRSALEHLKQMCPQAMATRRYQLLLRPVALAPVPRWSPTAARLASRGPVAWLCKLSRTHCPS